jgi:hypothetical protein
MSDRPKNSVSVTFEADGSEANAIDQLRRTLEFVDEMRKVGLNVEVRGFLDVRVGSRRAEVVTPVGDVTPEEAHRLAREHAAKVAAEATR